MMQSCRGPLRGGPVLPTLSTQALKEFCAFIRLLHYNADHLSESRVPSVREIPPHDALPLMPKSDLFPGW
jgi:hypothetical protein